MAHSTRAKRTAPRPGGWTIFAATLKLARWQTRQTWRLLLVVGFGILFAVILICTVPIYSQVAISAGIRDSINSTPEGSFVTVSSVSAQLSAQPIQGIQQELTQAFQTDMGPLISNNPQFSIQALDLNLLPPTPFKNAKLNLIGEDMSSAASHLQLLQGRLPRDTGSSSVMEVALVAQSAKSLGVTVGSTMPVQAFAGNLPKSAAALRNITLRVVGIFKLRSDNDLYWHYEDFQLAQAAGLPPPPPTFKGLVANQSLITVFSQVGTNQTFQQNGVSYIGPPEIFWYYPINVTQVNVLNLGQLVSGMDTAITNTSNNPVDAPFVEQTQASGPYSALLTYSNYVFVLLISAVGLIALLMALILYFVSAMTNLLVDRKTAAIAVLRSRGANRGQIFSLYVAQAIGLSIIALIIGPLLALVAVRLLTLNTLASSDQGALNILTANLGSVAVELLEYALAAIVIVLIAMILSIYRATRADIVSLRRESARATTIPFWQRTNLDLIAAFIALVGYAAILYITNPSVLSIRLRSLLLAPATLVGAVFLLLGATLLFLRGFPLLLELASRLAARSKGAASTLALAQMARTPQQTVRTTMLLAFATAFAIFALVFNASQVQRIQDVAAYQVGADFSGDISSLSANVKPTQFSNLPGVVAASTGYESSENVIGLGGLSLDLRAVYAESFARTAIWSSQYSSQSIGSLMQQLIAARSSANGFVPAIVDADAVQSLHLSIGSHFSLSDLNGQMNFVMIGEVQHLPSIFDTTASNDTTDYVPAGGVLVDFQTYNALSSQINDTPLSTTTVWVKSKSDPASVALVRKELLTGSIPVSNLSDRRAIVQTLSKDPLYLALLEILIASAIAALILALIGTLIASWQNAQKHLTSFSILRALGSSQGQIAGVLLWEQSIVYATALILGVLFGVFLSLLALPTLIFTSAGSSVPISSGEFYVLQSVPPINVVIPVSLWLALGVLVLICIVAIWMMVRIVSRPSISQILRLSED
ncbi:MAG: FtsX-like permease family protein [Ktedonobacteraceae bacterium]